jgi:type III restriction enzyme
MGSTPRKYISDSIVHVDEGHPDPPNLIVEIKGCRGDDPEEKANTMRGYWELGVNNLERYGRWGLRRVHRRLRDRGGVQPTDRGVV